jgi:hypothetical protein
MEPSSLSDQRGLLVAGNATDGERGSEDVADAEIGGAVLDLRQQVHRYVEQGAQVFIPAALADVIECRARCVGGVGGVHLPARETPDEEAVDCSRGKLATFGAVAGAWYGVENPGDLGGREIRVEDEAGALGHHRLVALRGKFLRAGSGAAVLPDNGVVDRLARFAIPYHHCLALVSDADGGGLAAAETFERLLGRATLRAPDGLGIVLDPAGLRKYLRKLFLRRRDHLPVEADGHGAAGGGALVERENDARCHACLRRSYWMVGRPL